jgi:hypothetical protein
MSEQRPDTGTGEFPPLNFPLIFTDGVLQMSYGHSMVRMYLARHDPSLNPNNINAATRPFAQLVMPLNGFLETALFFEATLSRLLNEKIITEQQLNELRAQREADHGR